MTAKPENIFAKPVPVIWGDADVKDTHLIIPDGMNVLQEVLLMQSWAVGSIENHQAYPLWSKQAREGMAEFFTAGEDVKNNYTASGGLGKNLVTKEFTLSANLKCAAGWSKNFTKYGERWLDVFPNLPNTPKEAQKAQEPLLNLSRLFLDIKKHTLCEVFKALSDMNALNASEAIKMLTDDLMLGMVYYAPTEGKKLQPDEPLHGWHADKPPLGFMLGPTTENPGIYLWSTLTRTFVPAPPLKENEFIIHTGSKLEEAVIKENFPFVPNYHYVENTPHARAHGRMALQFQG